MTRFVDRGAIIAAYVGIGMAVTMGISFLLIIPIEVIVWWLAIPSGLLIGYYANARSDRRAGPWSRILVNGLFAGVVTGLTTALLLLGVKALFFFADNGYPDFNRVDAAGNVVPPLCASGADCVYQRYLAADRGTEMASIGVTDAGSFTTFYWQEQASTALTVFALTAVGGLGGAALYGVFRPKPVAPGTEAATAG